MLRRLCCLGAALLLLGGLFLPVRAEGLELAAPAYVLMEKSTGEILQEKNAHERLPPASVTKIMTLLLVMEALEDGRISWQDEVTASAAAAAKGGSQIYLEENERLPLTEMLKSVVVSSANDCACALAEHLAGSEQAFVDMMNRRAQELGMQDTHFVNCTGLDDGPDAQEHLTSAYDIALMSRALLQHARIKEYTTIWMDSVRDGRFGLSNTNKLVRFYDGTTGLKTGYTSRAGHCLSASAERGGMELIAVVLNCKSSVDRFESAKAVLNYGFSNYALYTPQPEQAPAPIPVRLGRQETVPVLLEDETPVLMEKALLSSAETELTLEPELAAPVRAGQSVGSLRVLAGGKLVCERRILAAQDVEKLTFGEMFLRLLRGVCMLRPGNENRS